MTTSLAMTVIGPDRPGLVRILSDAVASHGGNWLESRMARLAGQFAGVVRVECAASSADALVTALEILGSEGLVVQVIREEAPPTEVRRTITVDVVGNDRPGIVRDFAAAIANAGGNVEELTTGLESAPMSGHPLFRAHGIISIPENSDAADLIAAIENLGSDLSVEIV